MMILKTCIYLLAAQLSWVQEINTQAEIYGVDPYTIMAMCYVESRWEPEADNGTNKGLMQISPYWWEEIIGDRDLFNPIENIDIGCEVFSVYMAQYGTEISALNHYNGIDSAELTGYSEEVLRIKEEIKKEWQHYTNLQETIKDFWKWQKTQRSMLMLSEIL